MLFPESQIFAPGIDKIIYLLFLVTTTSTTQMTSWDDVLYNDRDIHIHDGYVPKSHSPCEYAGFSFPTFPSLALMKPPPSGKGP